jgi:acetyltransferase
VGGVKLDVRNADEIAGAFDEVFTVWKSKDAKLKIAVSAWSPEAAGRSLGMTRDPQFGPVLMFGLGGIFVEVMKGRVDPHPSADEPRRPRHDRDDQGVPSLAGARGEARRSCVPRESLLRLSQAGRRPRG